MRYIIKQKVFTVADQFTINDANGQARFMVKSKFATIGKKFWVYNMQGQELFYLKQRLFKVFPTFEIYRGEEYIGEYKGKFAMFRKKAKITSAYGDYDMKGTVVGWTFNIFKDDIEVARISKQVRLADSYTIDVADSENQPFLLSMAIIIDAIYHRGSTLGAK